jgi:hypothetical protein
MGVSGWGASHNQGGNEVRPEDKMGSDSQNGDIIYWEPKSLSYVLVLAYPPNQSTANVCFLP